MVERTQRLVGLARRLPFPEGTYPVGAGIAIAGLTAYAFLSLAYHPITLFVLAACIGVRVGSPYESSFFMRRR